MSCQDVSAQRRYGDYTRQYSVGGRAGSRTRNRSLGLSFHVRSLAYGIPGASFCRDLGLAVYCVSAGPPGDGGYWEYLSVREEIMWTCSYEETPAYRRIGEGYRGIGLVGCAHQLHVRIPVSIAHYRRVGVLMKGAKGWKLPARAACVVLCTTGGQ